MLSAQIIIFQMLQILLKCLIMSHYLNVPSLPGSRLQTVSYVLFNRKIYVLGAVLCAEGMTIISAVR